MVLNPTALLRLNRRMMLVAALLFGVLVPGKVVAQQSANGFHFGGPVVAVTYDLERAKVANTNCGCFWLNGGSAEVAVPFYRGLGIVGSIGGGHASSSNPGAGLSKISYFFGPRYTIDTAHLGMTHGPQIFGQALFGGAHGFDSVFPASSTAVTSSANSYAMEFGGGVDFLLHHGFGVRAFEIDYVRTALPNNGSNTQNDLRLAFGVSYHFRTN
jgi:hypothetical protein